MQAHIGKSCFVRGLEKVKLTFTSILGKNCFMDSLGKLKNTDFGGMSIDIDVPKFLISA